MGRPPLPLGTAGSVRYYPVSTGVRARVQVRDMDGVVRHVERTARTKAMAERSLKEALRDRSHAATRGLLSPSSSLRELTEQWYQSLEGLSPTTMQAYRYRLDHQILPALGLVRLRELTAGLLDRHLKAVAAKHGPASAKMIRSVLSGCLGYATRLDLIERNLVVDLGRTPRQPRRAPRALSSEDLRDLLAKVTADPVAAQRDLPDLVLLMACTGMRIGEAVALTWAHVDLNAGLLTVAQTLIRVPGDGLVAKDTRTTAGHRTLHLPAVAVGMLKTRKAAPAHPLREHRPQPVFPAQLGGWRDPSNTQADLRAAFNTAGYPWVTSHTLRKTVATLMDHAGLSARATADQLGHANPSPTQDVYYGRGVPTTGAEFVMQRAFTPRLKALTMSQPPRAHRERLGLASLCTVPGLVGSDPTEGWVHASTENVSARAVGAGAASRDGARARIVVELGGAADRAAGRGSPGDPARVG